MSDPLPPAPQAPPAGRARPAGHGPLKLRPPPGLGRLVGTLVSLHAAMACARVATALVLLQQGQSALVVGLLLSLYGLAPMLLAVRAGQIADAKGFRGPMKVALGMALPGAAVMALTQHPAALALGGLLLGGALSVGAVGIQREAGLLTNDPGQLKQVFAWTSLGPALSNSISPVVIGLVIDHLGFRAAFGITLLLPMVAAIVAAQVVARPVAPRHSGTVGGSGTMRLLRMPVLRRLLIANVVLAAAWDAHTLVVPLLGHARGFSASQIGFVLGAFALASTLVRLAITRLGPQFDERRALGWAMAVVGGTLGIYPWMPGAVGMAAASFVLGAALGAVQPMILALLHHATPPSLHGRALGVRMMVTNGATLALPTTFGWLAQAVSLNAPLGVMAAASLGALLWWRRVAGSAQAGQAGQVEKAGRVGRVGRQD